jgi:hypothetical protein
MFCFCFGIEGGREEGGEDNKIDEMNDERTSRRRIL